MLWKPNTWMIGVQQTVTTEAANFDRFAQIIDLMPGIPWPLFLDKPISS